MAAIHNSIHALLSTLTESLSSATSSLPSDHTELLPPAEGISLLDTKNELLLSYIQNLVFLIILKLRQGAETERDTDSDLSAAAIEKLVELRIYTERGVRPLEGRLKYQIEKVLRAADDAERSAAVKVNVESKSSKTTGGDGSDEDDSEDSEAKLEDIHSTSKPGDLSYRPNPAALLQKVDTANKDRSSTSRKDSAYKPPRITPTSMPQSASTSRDKTLSRRERKSHLLDEYVSSELSSAPLAEPSIGSNSTILNRGRGSLSARDREKQKERMEYEERNLARLPGESKTEKRKARARGEGVRRNEYGGEDWTGLGEVGDRVARSVGRGKEGSRSVLERREKRRRDDGGGDRGGGAGIGDAFEKRRRVMEGRAERKGRNDK